MRTSENEKGNEFIESLTAFIAIFKDKNNKVKDIYSKAMAAENHLNKLTPASISYLKNAYKNNDIEVVAQYIMWCMDETITDEIRERSLQTMATITHFNL